jgi:transcriptional regulator
MYKMPEFTEKDPAVIFSFMQQNEFAMLTGNHNGRSVATQVPLLISQTEEGILLRGHIMRKTDHHLAFEQNPETLVLFTGPHCYVSSSWYEERSIGATWNYMTVHARGTMRFLDSEGTHGIIKELMDKYEAGQVKPELVENMPPEYVQGMVKAIVGFEILVRETAATFKLSQNRSPKSYQNILDKLHERGDCGSLGIAEEMERRKDSLFSK